MWMQSKGFGVTTDLRNKLHGQRPYDKKSAEDWHTLEKFERALESDRGRIINSAAVRRLQQKTQVFPLERNAAVRSRLTHSLEVQQTGRFITRTVFENLQERFGEHDLKGYERAVESMVEMACLMHDIGNPPFGHFGEAAISNWFAIHAPTLPVFSEKTEESAPLIHELSHFEGNAQGIRLLTSLQRLNLTYAQTACIFKYTRAASQPKPEKGQPFDYLQKKPGFYESERPFVAAMQQALRMEEGARYPLTYLMEAADDISYCLADIEDGVDKGLLSIDTLAALLTDEFSRQCETADTARLNGRSFADIIHYALRRAADEPVNKEHEFFLWVRVGLIHPLVNHAAERFVDNLQAVTAGTFNHALLEDKSPCHAVVETLKKVAQQHIFNVSEVRTLELKGYRILHSLLNIYSPLLRLQHDEFIALLNGEKGPLIEGHLAARLPKKHIAAYRGLLNQQSAFPPDIWEQYARCRLVQDMISGMTDQFAMDEYHELLALT